MERERVAVVAGASDAVGEAVVRELTRSHRVLLAGPAARNADLPGMRTWPAGKESAPPRVDVLVHCADLYPRGSIADTPDRTWRHVFEVNLFAVAELTRLTLPALRAARGRVIVVSSPAVAESPEGRAAYAASEAALGVFVEVLRVEEEQYGVEVTAIDLRPRTPRADGASPLAAAVRSVVDAPPELRVSELVVESA